MRTNDMQSTETQTKSTKTSSKAYSSYFDLMHYWL